MHYTHNRARQLLKKCSLAMALALAGSGAQAAHFIYTGGHELRDDELAALGHSYTMACFGSSKPAGGVDGDGAQPSDVGSTELCWASIFNGDYGPFNAIVFGEYGSVSSEADVAAFQNYVNNGGKVIFVDDHDGNTDDLNYAFGYGADAVYECKSDESIAASMTPSATGTAFANGPLDVRNLSCTSGLSTASLPPGAITFYAGESEPYFDRPAGGSPQTSSFPTSLVWSKAHGSGTVLWLGWDFCCGSEEYEEDWYIVLDNALKYSATPPGSANLRLSFSGPSTQVPSGTTVPVFARLDNYGRNNAVNPVVNFSLNVPAWNVSVSPPAGWSCSSGMETRAPAIDIPVGSNIRCSLAGSMPRTSVQFRLNVTTQSNEAGFHSIGGVASSDSVDPVPSNNSASFKLYVKAGGGIIAPVRTPIN